MRPIYQSKQPPFIRSTISMNIDITMIDQRERSTPPDYSFADVDVVKIRTRLISFLFFFISPYQRIRSMSSSLEKKEQFSDKFTYVRNVL